MRNEYLEPLWEAFDEFAGYPAIVDAGGSRATSYAELKTQVCRVIAWLGEQGVPHSSFIPVVLEQSAEYLAAEIGIWMAGHTAVPMGPSFPPERIAYICEHCDAPLVIDEAAWAQIAATAPADLGDGAPDYPPEEQPALLIYTSGSTGNPKGILHTFKGLATKHTAKVGLKYSPDEAWGMGAPLYFVASLTCFKVLKEGGQLHLYDAETYHDMRKLEDYIEEKGITFTFLSPSMLTAFRNRSDTLKVVFTGSERLTGQCSRDGYKLLNCYGMSETAGTVCAFEVKRPYDTTPVGKPEEKWCLLGDDGKPVAPGEEGEFCLSGVYCEGYYKDPERTAELYADGWLHTGDILRQLPDGNLVYVNRKDWMAKINGQRVEPGEVENACRRVEGVEQAVVKAFDGEGGGQYLCAFFTGEADGETVRAELARTLPPYMVPSFFVSVREFALLPNGKVNRKVLAPPDTASLRSGYVAPENDVQRTLCDAIAELFELERVGIDDDFFLLGGDSIRVMKLQQLCPDLPLSAKMIAEGRTPRAIADALADAGSAPDDAAVPAAAAASAAARRSGPVPLSQTQLGIYAESVAREGEAVYNNPVLLEIDPSIDEERLARAVEAAIEAHPFVKLHVEQDDEGTPVMVAGDYAYSQSVETLSRDAFEVLKTQLIEPFDLHIGPLFRIRVIRVPEALYLFTDFHHLIYDGTSMRVLMADIDAAYAGQAVEPETYTGFDVAFAEAQARESGAYERAKEWYEGVFGGLDVDSVPLPDRAGDEVTFATLDVPLGIDAATVGQFCKRSGITANVLAVAAFGKVLGAFANSEEALFATIYNGRGDLRCARTVDMMVKTLPVYCRLGADLRVADYLAAVKDQVMGAMANDLYSFAEASALCGVTSDVLFAYQGDYLALGSVCGGAYRRVDLGGNATGSPLDFQLFIVEGALSMHVEYQSNRYSEGFVSDMARMYACVLRGLIAEERLGNIELVDDSQLAALETFHGREVDYDRSQTVVSLFRAAAALYPDNDAAVCEDEKLTYRELDELTDRLARYIRSLGLGTGDVVSVLIERGLWMPVASLGALKAGCAYQPLDATYPPERLNFMVGDADAKLLITTRELRGVITEYDGAVLEVAAVGAASIPEAAPAPADGAAPADALRPVTFQPSPEDLFILLYTSGTTGTPKGVRLTHGNLVCFIDWYHRYYGIGPDHRVGAYASYGFDACMMDLYPALTCGATVVIVPEQMRLDLMAMGRYLELNGVTDAFMTTQVGRQFAIDAECSTLRKLSMGGETLVPFDAPEGLSVYNAYGPTECTIYSTIYAIAGGEASYPIGVPLDNMRAYVVSACGHRLPAGAIGELWLSGPQVGDGYLNRPDKTAEAFGSDPFDDAGAPLYRTGDVVRFMRDGNIEFIGRRDGQVKIRGFRIELAEVEGVVRAFPGIRDATVAAFDHPSGGKYVAAYVVSDDEIDTDALADFIRERKPPYMVPAVTMRIERIPLNQNGKVNRRALPVPDLAAAEGFDDEDDRARPMNALERGLHDIAAEVIATDNFGPTTPLVRCGLTSIQSLRLLALVYKRFGVTIHAADLDDDFSVVTLEDLILAEWMSPEWNKPRALVAEGAEGGEGDKAARPGPLAPAPLTFAQAGVYYECLKNPASCVYNVPIEIALAEGVSADDAAAALEAVVAAHPVLLAHFEQSGEDVVLAAGAADATGAEGAEGGAAPAAPAAPIERIDTDAAGFAELRASFVRPFDLHAGPLCRFVVATVEGHIRVLADFHHLVFDGASTGVFLNDLARALCGDAVASETFTFADYANDEHTFASSDDFEDNRAYFAELLSDFETASELAPDKTGAKGPGSQARASAPLDLDAIEAYCRDASTTPAAFMLAATSYALARYVNERTVHIATISNGRADVRLADTVGMFVNTLPLAVEIADVSAADFVQRCAGYLSAAIAHERYPFARIAADFGYAPNIMYEYQIGAVDAGGAAGFGGTLEAVEGIVDESGGDAKFKLSIHIEQLAGAPAVVAYYDDALYTRELMEGLARSIAIAAAQLLADPSSPVRCVSLVDEERRAQLERFHEEATGPLDFELYHAGLERQARLVPDKTALVAVDGTFTFAELNAWANRIAHALIDRGVAPRSRIALLLPRTARVIMAMFGVMKAGCAYIPCDPTYPEERVRHILDDSGAPVVITTSEHVDEYEGALDVEDLLSGTRDDDPALDVSPDDLAYLIYTSGSTGKPKGVMLTHRGVCNFHANHPANILVDALVERAHALLAVTTLSFDMSVKEVGTPLVNGLCVVLADETQVNDPASLARLFAETGADAFNATHSRLAQYLELPAFAEAIGKCSVVLSGGEKYTEGLLPLLQRTTDARIINTYGPTETTVSSNMADLTHAARVTVGRPLYNVWECIVDADGNELPAGVVGELLIGGPGVGAGYNNLPEKTAEAFIERDGRRLYRSGDYARWTADGLVEILGRTDNQVKLRGLRIELGEVESALVDIADVTRAVVKIAEVNGAEHLCAYYTATRPIDPLEVRELLAATLARYMVPTAYLQLDALPLTPNGKVDYRGLPPASLLQSGGAVAAANEAEQFFCDVFASILGLDEVGATDSFFEIGGTSLLAIRITVEASNAGYLVTYADVFANPTPRELATLCAPHDDAVPAEGVAAGAAGAAAAEAGAGTAAGIAAEASVAAGAAGSAAAGAATASQGNTGAGPGATFNPPSSRPTTPGDPEIEGFDYGPIDSLLAGNNLKGFVEGSRRNLGNILLTGAAGYLGIHILHEYLENYSGTAYCLLRGHDDISATQRLKFQLFYYFEHDYAELFGNRIVVVEGDITRELPIAADTPIDTVVNCAAVVKHFSAGTEIEDVNVGGVHNLVEFCVARAIPLVQISTGSTVKCALKPGASVMGKVGERQLYIGQELANQYVRSKFIAERIVLDAVATRGLAAKVMRVGNLAPRTADGEFQINYDTNAAMGRLKSFALMGCAPFDQLDATMEFSPIDETARAILLLAQTPRACVLFHPFNHHAVLYGDVFDAMGKCGLAVRPVEREQFARVLKETGADPEKASVLTSLLAYARRADAKPVIVPSAGNAYTMQVLYRMGFRWNPTSTTYVEQFLEALEGLGFFDL